jgi:hypothetical protein
MKHEPYFRSCLCAAALALAATGAAAQSGPTAKLYCHTVGNGAPEALGDREGHTVAVGQFTCRVEGGPTDGGILTGITIVEWDKGSAVLLSGTGITRKPGAVTAYQHLEGKSSLVMTDGKPTGVAGSGRGRYTLATGSAASLVGKTYGYTFSTTGPGQFVVEVKHD